MLTVLSFCAKDADQAERLAAWLIDLSGCKGHDLLLGVDNGVTTEVAGRIMALFQQSFDKVTVLPIANPYNEWPTAANHAFSTIARHIENSKLAPYWIWLEPDSVPLNATCFTAIEKEYLEAVKAGKLFLADFVNVHNITPHASGVAVYPAEMTKHAGMALIAHEEAWDFAASSQILPKTHTSKLIVHRWKHDPFTSWEHVEQDIFNVKPECVLFHASKDGSLIDLLRARKNLSGGTGRNDGAVTEADTTPAASRESCSGLVAKPPAQKIDCAILIKSYPADFEWLRYCLRAIDKFATGFRPRVTLILPKGSLDGKFPFGMGIKNDPNIIEVVEAGDSYLFQQCCKASAHEFTDADYVLHVDSDVILTQSITPESFFHDGKPIWYMSPYSSLGESVPWKPITEKFLGEPVEFEFMRRFPLLIPRDLHKAAAGFCMVHHKMRLTDYILSQPNREYSEFNCLGALAYSRARDDFHWIDTTL